MSVLVFLLFLSAPRVEMVPVSPVYKISISRLPVNGVPLLIRNNTRAKVEFWHSGFYPNHCWSMKTELGIPVKLTKIGGVGAKRFGSPDRDANVRFFIASGKTHRERTPPLDQAFELKPGTYTLDVMYHEKTQGPPLRLVCPRIKVIVTR